MQKEKYVQAVTAIVTKAPQWLRHDLASNLPLAKERAEEALIAMIVAAFDAAEGEKRE